MASLLHSACASLARMFRLSFAAGLVCSLFAAHASASINIQGGYDWVPGGVMMRWRVDPATPYAGGLTWNYGFSDYWLGGSLTTCDNRNALPVCNITNTTGNSTYWYYSNLVGNASNWHWNTSPDSGSWNTKIFLPISGYSGYKLGISIKPIEVSYTYAFLTIATAETYSNTVDPVGFALVSPIPNTLATSVSLGSAYSNVSLTIVKQPSHANATVSGGVFKVTPTDLSYVGTDSVTIGATDLATGAYSEYPLGITFRAASPSDIKLSDGTITAASYTVPGGLAAVWAPSHDISGNTKFGIGWSNYWSNWGASLCPTTTPNCSFAISGTTYYYATSVNDVFSVSDSGGSDNFYYLRTGLNWANAGSPISAVVRPIVNGVESSYTAYELRPPTVAVIDPVSAYFDGTTTKVTDSSDVVIDIASAYPSASISVGSSPSSGSMTIASGKLVYHPAPGYAGTVSFSLAVSVAGHSFTVPFSFTQRVTATTIASVVQYYAPGGILLTWPASGDTTGTLSYLMGWTDYVSGSFTAKCTGLLPNCKYTGPSSSSYYFSYVTPQVAASDSGGQNFGFIPLGAAYASGLGRGIASVVVPVKGTNVLNASYGASITSTVIYTDPVTTALASIGDLASPVAVSLSSYSSFSGWAVSKQPSNAGSVAVSGTTLTYTPKPGFVGSDSFELSATVAGVSVSGIRVPVTQVLSGPAPVTGLVATPVPGGMSLSWTNADSSSSTTYNVRYNLGASYTAFVSPCDAWTPTCKDSSSTATAVYSSPTRNYTLSLGGVAQNKLLYAFVAPVRNGVVGSYVSVSGYVDVAPIASALTFSTPQGVSAVISPAWLDADSWGDSWSVSVTKQPSHGSVLVSGGKLIYTPNAGFVGPDTFSYSVADAFGGSSSADVTGSVTPPAPAQVSGLTATTGTQVGHVSLAWSTSANATHYKVLRRSSPSDSSPVVVSPSVSVTAFTDTPPSPSVQYWYSVIALDDYGQASLDSSQAIGWADSAPSSASGTFAATLDTAASVSLTWTDPDKVFGDSGTVSIVSQPAHGSVVVSGNTASYTPSLHYIGDDSFTFKVTDAAGASVTGLASGSVAALTPGVPTSVSATQGTRLGSVLISWAPASNALWYTVKRGISAADPAPSVVATNVAGTSFSDTSVSVGQHYFYWVVGETYGKSGSPSSYAMGYSDSPPTSTSASYAGVIDVVGQFSPTVVDPDPSDSWVYSIVSQPSNGVATVSGGKLVFTPSQHWVGSDSFTYSATDVAGGSVVGTASITYVAPTPSPATSLTATQGTVLGSVNLTWSAGSNAQWYQVWRGTSSSDFAPSLVSDSVTGTSFSDSTATPGVTYWYRVSSATWGQVSSPTSYVSGFADTPPSGAVASGSAVTATLATISPTWVDPDPGDYGTLTITVPPSHGSASVSGTSFKYTSAAGFQGTDTFTFKVTDRAGGSAVGTASVNVVMVPGAVSSISATKGTKAGEVDVSWTSATNATSYFVYRGTSSSDPSPALIGVSSTTSFADVSTAPGTTYWYSVKGMNASVEGPLSATASGYADTPPSSVTGSFSSQVNSSVVFTISWTDPDPSESATISFDSQPSHGSVAWTGGANLRYTAASDYVGADSFLVRVTDKAGSSATATISGSVVASVPSIPTGVSATKATKLGEVDVAWSASTYGRSYNVYVGSSVSDSSPVLIGSTSSTSFADTSAPAGAQRYYFVQAVNFDKTSGLSAGVLGFADTPPSAATASFTCNQESSVSFSPTYADPDFGDAFTLAIVTQPSNGAASVSSGKLKYVANSGFAGDDSFQFSVTDKAGAVALGTASGSVVAFTPAAPSGVSATKGTKVGEVDVSWNPVSYARSYSIFAGSSASDPSPVLLGSSATSSFVDTGSAPGVSRYYFVQAQNFDKSSALSTSALGYSDTPPSGVSAGPFLTTTDVSVVVPVTWVDPDPSDPGVLTVSVAPANGAVSVQAGSVKYTPSAGYFGADSFTLTVTDKAGASASAVVSGQVVNVPGPVSSLSASQGTLVGAVALTWNAATNASTYSITRRTSPSDTSPVVFDGVEGLSYSDSTALPGATYTYSIHGVVLGVSGPESSTVTGYSDTPPSAPVASFTAEYETPVSITPTWLDPDPSDQGTLAIQTGPSHGVAIVSGRKVTYTPDSGYQGSDSFVLTVTDKAGASASSQISGTVQASVPSVPLGVTATQGTIFGSVRVTWSSSTSARSYNVYGSLTPNLADASLLGNVQGLVFDDVSSPPGVVKYYWVTAINVDKASGPSSVTSGFADTAPSGAAASFTTDINTTTTFSPLWSDPDSGDVGILAIATQPSLGKASVSGKSLVYVPNPDASGADSFTFTVTDRAGATTSGTATGSIVVPVPSPPSGLVATKASLVGEVKLTWLASAKARTYRVLRSESSDSASASVVADGVSSTEYHDTGALVLHKYYYWVQAVLLDKASALSSSALGYVDTPPENLSGTFHTVNDKAVTFLPTWTDVDAGDVGTLAVAVQPSHGTAVVTKSGIQYQPAPGYVGTDSFTFSVTDQAGAIVMATAYGIIDPGVPLAPLGFTVSQGTRVGLVRADWSASVGASSYLVYRASSAGGSHTLIATVTDLFYEDSSVTPGTKYYYQVKARGSVGDSAATTDILGYADTPPSSTTLNLVTRVATPVSAAPTVVDPDAGDVFTVTLGAQPSHGVASVAADGLTVTYVPDAGFGGVDTFPFTVSDRARASVSGIASVSVGCDAPVASQLQVPSGKVFAGTGVQVSVHYGNKGCSASLSGSLSVKLNGQVIQSKSVPSLSPSIDQLLSFNIDPLAAGSYVVEFTVSDSLTSLSSTVSTTLSVSNFQVPSFQITPAPVAKIDVASLSIDSSPDCSLTLDASAAIADPSLCLVQVTGLPTEVVYSPQKSSSSLVWQGKPLVAGTYSVLMVFSRADAAGNLGQMASANATMTVASSDSLVFTIPPVPSIPQYLGHAGLVPKQTSGPACSLTTDLSTAKSYAAAGQRKCFLEFTSLPPTSSLLPTGVSVSFPDVGTVDVPWTVSTFDLDGSKIALFQSSTQVVVRPNQLDYEVNVGSVPPLAGLTKVQFSVYSAGTDKCSLSLTESKAHTTSDDRPCLFEWLNLPDGISQVPGQDVPLISGVFQTAGTLPVAYDVSYFDLQGQKHLLVHTEKGIVVSMPPMPDMVISGGYQVSPGVYAVSTQGGGIGSARFVNMVWPLDLTLHWSDSTPDVAMPVASNGYATLTAGPAPLWSRRTLTITRSLRSAPELNASADITVLAIPPTGTKVVIDQISSSVADTDVVPVRAHVEGRLPNGTGYDPSVLGQWAIQFGYIDTHGKFQPQGDPVVADADGYASSTLNPFGLAQLQAQAVAVPYMGDPAYTATIKSNVTVAKVVKGTPIEGSVVPLGLQNGPAPLVAIVRLLYATTADTLAATDLQWWITSDAGVTWSHIDGADSKVMFAKQLTQGTYKIKASFVNKNTGQKSETSPLDFVAWPTPLIQLDGPTYAFVGTPISINIVLSNVTSGLPLGDTEQTWKVEWMEYVNRQYVPHVIAQGTDSTIVFSSDTAGYYRITVQARSLQSDPNSTKSWRTLVKNFTYAPPKSPMVSVGGPAKAEVGKPYTFTTRISTSYSLEQARQTLGGEWVLPDGTTVPGNDPLVYTPTQDDFSKSNKLTLEHRAWIENYKDVTTSYGKFSFGIWLYKWPDWHLMTSLPTTVSPVTFAASVVPSDQSIVPYLDGLKYQWSVPETMQVVGVPGAKFTANIEYGSENNLSLHISDARGNSSDLSMLIVTTNPLPYVIDLPVTNQSKWSHAPLNLYVAPKVTGGHPLDTITQWQYTLDGALQASKNASTASIPVASPGVHTVGVTIYSKLGAVSSKSVEVEIPAAEPPQCTLTAQRGSVDRTVSVTYACTSAYGYLTNYSWSANGVSLGNLSKPSTWTYAMPAGMDFPVTIQLQATDDAGLQATLNATSQ